MTAPWQLRRLGEATPLKLDHPQKVLDGLRDGTWDTADEVRGPGESLWQPIEDHPAFADAVAEMGPPPPPHDDETHLDMNPLIDVTLVLLIFFILTAAVTTMRRTIELPAPPSDDKATAIPKKEDLKDVIFNVKVSLNADEQTVIAIENRVIVTERLEQELIDTVKTTGRKELYLIATDDVPWDTIVKIHGAAAEAGIRQIHQPRKK